MPAVLDAKALREIPLFTGLTDAQLERVNQLAHRKIFPAGAAVITMETPGEVVYAILKGTVKIKIDQVDGTEVIIAMLGPGEVVGELSVLDSYGRSADVLTLEDTTLLWLDRSGFESLLREIPAIKDNMLRLLSRRVRLSTEQIQALCTLDVYGKVARQLLVFADQYGVTTPEGRTIPMRLTQSDVAGMVGASRERVNQVFVSLRGRKLLAVDKDYRVTLPDPEKLRELLRQR
jgi:CRP/FNR family cyclic AMP-dependent transcriptional regulator